MIRCRAACGSRRRRRPRPCSARSRPAARGPPRSAPCRARSASSGYGNGSDIQLFMPRSRSVMTKTGVWNCSARSKASLRHGEALLRRGREAASGAWCRRARAARSTGCRPARCASAGRWTGPRAARRRSRPALRRSSRGRRTPTSARCPGPEVAVMERAPAQPAPITMPIAASSSSACTTAKVALPVSGSMPEALHVADQRFDQRRRRRDRIPGHHRHAGEHRAQRAGRVAVDDDLARGLVHPLDAERVGLGAGSSRRSRSPPATAPQFSSAALALRAPNCFDQRLADLLHVDAEQLGHARRRRSCCGPACAAWPPGRPAPPACRTAPGRSAGRERSSFSFSGSS